MKEMKRVRKKIKKTKFTNFRKPGFRSWRNIGEDVNRVLMDDIVG